MLAFGTPIVDVAGLDSNSNPPDTVGDVGPNHYVQMVNSSFYQIHDKTGAVVQGSTAVDSLGTGVCSTGRGDPIVIYDHLADRWLLSEFAQRADTTLCVYISQTPDPTAAYFEYQVPTPNFPDYPKFALGNDAYFVGTNETDTSVYALPRAQMLAGPGATITPIRRTTTDLPNWNRNHITPADLDGPAAPAGSPGLYVRQVDDEITNPGGNDPANDFIEVWAFQPDFVTPANSTYALIDTVSINEFDYNLCNWSRDCLAQPGTTAQLDALPHYINNRAQYRNFGTHETLMLSFTEDASVNQAGVRWVELRDTGAGWTAFQEGTVAPDADSRWMGAISMNSKGDVALMYNVTGPTTSASVRYIGRQSGDPLGTMPQGEFAVPGGTGSSFIDFRPCSDGMGGTTNNNCQRWGDYSAMSVDPVDDTTFWFTGMYVEANGSTDTRIAAVQFDEAPVINSLVLDALSIDEGESVTLTGVFEDWNALEDHTVEIDWNDGSSNTILNVPANNSTTKQFEVMHSYVDDHPSSLTASDNFDIDVTVTDENGLSDNGDTPITVSNVAPEIDSINFSASGIDEGQSVTVSGTFSDPAAAASTEIFVAQALWSDGVTTPVTVSGPLGTFTTDRTFLDDHPMTGTPFDDFTVDITLDDDDLGTDTETSGTLTVFNVDPVINDFESDATLEDKAEEGETVNVLANFTDVGVLDTHTAEIDWGDGTVEMGTVIQGAGVGSVTGSHAYASGGIFTVTVTVTDDDTGVAEATTTAVVTGVGINNGVLYIVGTNEEDHVSVNRTGKNVIKVHTDFLAENFRDFDGTAVDKIIAYLCEGDDHLTISNRVTTPAILHGGGGNDHINAGGGPTVMLGNGGDDTLVGGGGRNILIGGEDSDRLIGGKDDDVLIGGSTTSDQDDDALMAVLVAWDDPTDPYNVRVGAVDALLTVIDDADADKLTGSSGRDLFYDGLGDSTPGRKPIEDVL